MITENLSTLKINKLTQEQYNRELANGNIDENALYLVPDESSDLSIYATKEELGTKADSVHDHDSLYYREYEIDEMLSNTKKKDLIVTFADSTKQTSTHTSAEIYGAIQNGTTVYFNNGGTNFHYLEGASSVITFYTNYFDNDVMQADAYIIRGNQIEHQHFQNDIITQTDIDAFIEKITSGTIAVKEAEHATNADNATTSLDAEKLGGQLPSYYAKSTDIPTGTLADKDIISESDLDSALIEKVNAAAEGNHSHNNKTVLDGITDTKVYSWDNAEANAKAYADSAVSTKANAEHNHDLDYDEIGAANAVQDALNEHTGKSDIHFTATERTKLSGIETGAQKNTITGVKGNSESSYRTGNVNITKANIGLGNVDNTSDANKPVSTAQQTAIDNSLNSAKTYTDTKIANLLDNSTEAVDSVMELAEAMKTNADAIEALEGVAASKANASDLTSHTSNKSNPHGVTKSQVGLGNVENKSSATIRSEITKSNVTTALGYTPYTQTEVDSLLDVKVDKVSGKGLSTNDYTTAEKTKLSGIAEGAEVNQNAFGKVTVGSSTITADAEIDTLTIVAGTGISLTADTSTDKVTITNSGVRSVYTGSTNGTISVNTDGENVEVAVKGLGSAAYTESSAYAEKSHGTHVTWSTTSPKMNGTATVGTETKVARGDHIHPTDTSRASQTDLDALEAVVDGKAPKTHSHPISDVTNLQSTLDGKQATITGGATTIASSNLTASRALVSNSSGKVAVSAVTSTELGYLDGVTSNVQTQIDSKLDLSGGIMTGDLNFANKGIIIGVTNNTDQNLLKVHGGADGEYGFRLQYNGTGSGNNNSLSIFTDNQTGDEIEAIEMLQDGTTTFYKKITASGGVVGNLTGNADTATTATKLGSSTLGSSTKPVYLSSGTATECSTYAGGTKVTLNGSGKGASTASFYAPTSAGTSGYVLTSAGSGAPTWTQLPTMCNPNLLINGDLQVWQRGESITIGNDKWYYTADRFRCKGSGTVTKTSNGLQVSASTQIQQVLEDISYLNGKTVTLSYSKNGVVTTNTFTVSSEVLFDITLSANDILNWVKVEMGSVATTLIPRQYSEEFALCQRYYQHHRNTWARRINSNVAKYRLMDVMRIEPTFSGTFTLWTLENSQKETLSSSAIYTQVNCIDIFKNNLSYEWHVRCEDACLDAEIY